MGDRVKCVMGPLEIYTGIITSLTVEQNGDDQDYRERVWVKSDGQNEYEGMLCPVKERLQLITPLEELL